MIGAAHAGWRGAVGGRAGGDRRRHAARWAPSRARSVAAIGPCIGQASYEVGADLRDAVLARDPADARVLRRRPAPAAGSSTCPATARARLRAAGVAQVEALAADTLADEARFFSHRRRTLAGGGPIGHQISAIVLYAGSWNAPPPLAGGRGRGRTDRDLIPRHPSPNPLPQGEGFSSVCAMLAVLALLAGCGDLPRPFAGNPGAMARRLSQPPPARLAVPVPTDALLAEAASAALTRRWPPRCRTRKCRRSPRPCASGDWSC